VEEGGDENEEKEQDPRRIFERVCGGVDGSVHGRRSVIFVSGTCIHLY